MRFRTPLEETFAAFFGVKSLQETLADKRRHPGANDKKNNFGVLAILLTYISRAMFSVVQ